jgi:hypothetical protein
MCACLSLLHITHSITSARRRKIANKIACGNHNLHYSLEICCCPKEFLLKDLKLRLLWRFTEQKDYLKVCVTHWYATDFIIMIMLKDFVAGNFECEFYTFIRLNRSSCEKCNYIGSLAWIELAIRLIGIELLLVGS